MLRKEVNSMTEQQVKEMIREAEQNRAELISERKELVKKFGWDNREVRQYTKDIKELWDDIQNLKEAYSV